MARNRFWPWWMLAAAAVGAAVLICRMLLFDMPLRAKEAALRTDLRTMRDCIEQFHGDKGRYPARLAELVATGYLYKMPIDPVTRRADTWTVQWAPIGADRPVGVVDVHSGSQKRSSDRRPYSEW